MRNFDNSMTIHIELGPEAEYRYAAEARERGLTLQRLLEEKLNEPETTVEYAPKASPEQLEASLDALARYSDKIPPFSMESFPRAAFYEDHD